MASHPDSTFLYILDCLANVIIVDTLHNVVRSRWHVIETPKTLSVTSFGSSVLIAFEDSQLVREYTPDGLVVREITMDGLHGSPTHVIQLDVDRFVVSQGTPGRDGLHRVCLFDEDGKLLQSFGGERGSGEWCIRFRVAAISSERSASFRCRRQNFEEYTNPSNHLLTNPNNHFLQSLLALEILRNSFDTPAQLLVYSGAVFLTCAHCQCHVLHRQLRDNHAELGKRYHDRSTVGFCQRRYKIGK